MVHSVIYTLKEFPGVHFRTLNESTFELLLTSANNVLAHKLSLIGEQIIAISHR
jgi:hypothetical protein